MPAPPLAGLKAAAPQGGPPPDLMAAGTDQQIAPAQGAMGKNPYLAQAMALTMQTQANPDMLSTEFIGQLMKLLQKAMEFTNAPTPAGPMGPGPGGPPPVPGQ